MSSCLGDRCCGAGREVGRRQNQEGRKQKAESRKQKAESSPHLTARTEEESRPWRLTTTSRMPFDLQPALKGQLLELRPLRAEDLHDLYTAAADPLIWEQHPVKDRYKEEVFTVFFRESLESGGTLIAIDAKHGQVIGSSRFHAYNEEKSEIEIGWTFLARSHWGGVYNGEMKQLMLRHAFRFVTNVVFLVGPENWRSQRAVEKIGGVRMGSRLDGGGRKSFIYQITASAFAQPRGSDPVRHEDRP
jgi:N-acetyltransferase